MIDSKSAHNLSLITDNDLPHVATFPGTPKIIEWGKYIQRCSFRKSNIHYRKDLFTEESGSIYYTGTGISPAAQIAVAEGAAYRWDREACVQTASLLWRTEKDSGRVMGLSRAVLCLGVPTDHVGKAVAFQTSNRPPIVPSLLKSGYNEPPPGYVACSRIRQSNSDFYSPTKYEKWILFATKKSTLSIRIYSLLVTGQSLSPRVYRLPPQCQQGRVFTAGNTFPKRGSSGEGRLSSDRVEAAVSFC